MGGQDSMAHHDLLGALWQQSIRADCLCLVGAFSNPAPCGGPAALAPGLALHATLPL